MHTSPARRRWGASMCTQSNTHACMQDTSALIAEVSLNALPTEQDRANRAVSNVSSTHVSRVVTYLLLMDCIVLFSHALSRACFS